eukprot:scaffold1533_cov388-Prasinococcus_capsulatus_cf.AAC.1
MPQGRRRRAGGDAVGCRVESARALFWMKGCMYVLVRAGPLRAGPDRRATWPRGRCGHHPPACAWSCRLWTDAALCGELVAARAACFQPTSLHCELTRMGTRPHRKEVNS